MGILGWWVMGIGVVGDEDFGVVGDEDFGVVGDEGGMEMLVVGRGTREDW